MDKYRPATYKEKVERGCPEEYSLLLGPNDFESVLGEPEDRTWERDGRDVIEELNRLLSELSAYRAQAQADQKAREEVERIQEDR